MFHQVIISPDGCVSRVDAMSRKGPLGSADLQRDNELTFVFGRVRTLSFNQRDIYRDLILISDPHLGTTRDLYISRICISYCIAENSDSSCLYCIWKENDHAEIMDIYYTGSTAIG